MPLQYMLLLHVKGFPDRDWATVGELAERPQASPHGTVALVSRCESAGQTQTQCTRPASGRSAPACQGERCLAKLAVLHKSAIQ